MSAYERDNQRQDEAEGDPGNRQELHEPGHQEGDPEAEADVSVLFWSRKLVTHRQAEPKKGTVPDSSSWLLVGLLIRQRRASCVTLKEEIRII